MRHGLIDCTCFSSMSHRCLSRLRIEVLSTWTQNQHRELPSFSENPEQFLNGSGEPYPLEKGHCSNITLPLPAQVNPIMHPVFFSRAGRYDVNINTLIHKPVWSSRPACHLILVYCFNRQQYSGFRQIALLELFRGIRQHRAAPHGSSEPLALYTHIQQVLAVSQVCFCRFSFYLDFFLHVEMTKWRKIIHFMDFALHWQNLFLKGSNQCIKETPHMTCCFEDTSQADPISNPIWASLHLLRSLPLSIFLPFQALITDLSLLYLAPYPRTTVAYNIIT